jgi:hypothetical protein
MAKSPLPADFSNCARYRPPHLDCLSHSNYSDFPGAGSESSKPKTGPVVLNLSLILRFSGTSVHLDAYQCLSKSFSLANWITLPLQPRLLLHGHFHKLLTNGDE